MNRLKIASSSGGSNTSSTQTALCSEKEPTLIEYDPVDALDVAPPTYSPVNELTPQPFFVPEKPSRLTQCLIFSEPGTATTAG
jgi:hypothetical protein